MEVGDGVGGASLTGEAGEVVEDGEFLLWAGLRLPRGGGNNDADSNCVRETRHAAASRVQLALLEVCGRVWVLRFHRGCPGRPVFCVCVAWFHLFTTTSTAFNYYTEVVRP